MLGRQTLLFFTLFLLFEFFNCQKRILDISESRIKKKVCIDGYTGDNCSVSTCIGYTLCKNESICLIKNNTHACVCQFLDNDGHNRQIEDCIGKYKINNGVCYLKKNGDKYCNCFKNWKGINCESKMLFNTVLEKLKKSEPTESALSEQNECDYFEDNHINDGIVYDNFINIKNGYEIIYHDKYDKRVNAKKKICCNQGWKNNGIDCKTVLCILGTPCQGVGTCIFIRSYIHCICPGDYHGDKCQDLCNMSCGNGYSTYHEGKMMCLCYCNDRYFAPRCEDLNTTTTQKTTIPTTITTTPTTKTTATLTNILTTTPTTTTTHTTTPTTTSTTTRTTTTTPTTTTTATLTTSLTTTLNTTPTTTPTINHTNTSKTTPQSSAYSKTTVTTNDPATDSTMESTKRATTTEYTSVVTTNSEIPKDSTNSTTNYNSESKYDRSDVDAFNKSNRIKLAYIAIPALLFVLAPAIVWMVIY